MMKKMGSEMQKILREELFEKIIYSDLPDELSIEKIIDRAYEFQKVNSCISFSISRHPGLGRRMSRGKGIGLSAYWDEKTKYTYHLDQEKWEIEVLSSTLEYDSWQMAMEEVDSLSEGGFLPSEIHDKQELEAIIKKAQKIIHDYYIETCGDDLSEDFYKMLDSLSVEMRKRIEAKYSLGVF